MNTEIGSLIYRIRGKKYELLLRKSVNNSWTFAKGIINQHEQVKDAVNRINLQHMGYNVNIGALAGEYKTFSSKIYIYLSTALSQGVFDDTETSEVKWFSFKDANRMINKTTSKQLKEIDLQILYNSSIMLLSGFR